MAPGYGVRDGGYAPRGDPSPPHHQHGGYGPPPQQGPPPGAPYAQQPPPPQQWPPQQQPDYGAPQPLPQRAPRRGGTLRELFEGADARGAGRIADRELRAVLADAGLKFSLECCRLLIAMHQSKGADHEITYEEFALLHQYIERNRQQFQKLGPDERGVLGPSEVHAAVTQSGYSLSRECFSALMKKFDRWGQHGIALDGFIELSAFLHNVKDTFAYYDKARTGHVLFNFDAFTLASCHQHTM